MKLDPSRLRNPIWITVLIMVLGAVVGVVIGSVVAFIGTLIAMSLSGPVGLVVLLPLFLTNHAIVLIVVVLVVPIWAVLGGWWFALMASGMGGIAQGMNVTLFSEGHPIHQFINKLAAELDLPPIKWIGWYEDDSINAFAAGVKQDQALIAFSRGAVQKLTKPQFEAVAAHELAHVANNDMARMTYARGVQDALTFFLALRGLRRIARLLFTPTSELELGRLSRQREYWADAVAAVLTSPEAMIGALRAIQVDNDDPPAEQSWFATYAIRANGFSWFDTHPPVFRRVRAIEEERFIERLPRKPERKGANQNSEANTIISEPSIGGEAHEHR